jgi:hypothetical protein
VIAVVAFLIQCGIHWLRDFVARKTGRAPPLAVKQKVVEEEQEVETEKESIV